jgi:hypothetical protein
VRYSSRNGKYTGRRWAYVVEPSNHRPGFAPALGLRARNADKSKGERAMKNVPTARAAVLVAAAFVLGSFGGRWARTASPTCGGPYEVARRLCARGLCLRVVPVSAAGPFRGAYLTTTDQTWDELVVLPWAAKAAARWRGTVLCMKDSPQADPTGGATARVN